jgi:hypothetical protein
LQLPVYWTAGCVGAAVHAQSTGTELLDETILEIELILDDISELVLDEFKLLDELEDEQHPTGGLTYPI